MAVELRQTFRFNLGDLVKSRLEAFQRSRSEAQVAEELKFYQQTAAGMSYDEQLSFRQAQEDREQEREVPDQSYLASLKKEISALKKLSLSEKFANAYRESFTRLQTGMASYQEHLDFLQEEFGKTKDPQTRKTISDYLSQARTSQYDYEQKILDNYYQYAYNDQTEAVLNKAIEEMKKERAKASGGGDALRASALDLKLQAMTQKLNEAKINKAVNQFSLATLKTYNPSDYLDLLNDKISSAEQNTPISYKGVTYANEKEFWLTMRRDYFESGKFAQANEKYWKETARLNYNQSVELYPIRAALMAKELSSFLNRNDLADFKAVIAGSNGGILAEISNTAAASILHKATVDYDFQTAANKLSQLSRDMGVDQTGNYQLLLDQTAKVNAEAVRAIYEISDEYVKAGMPEQQAVAAAIKAYNAGAAYQPSPKELGTQAPTETVAKTEAAAQAPTGRTAIAWNEGDLIKSPSNPQVYRIEGGLLRAIGGEAGQNVTEQALKTATGKGFTDIRQVANVADLGLPKGEDLLLKAQPLLYRTKVGQRYGSFAPETEFVLEGKILRPISSLAAKEKVASGAQAQEVDLSFFNDKTLGEIL